MAENGFDRSPDDPHDFDQWFEVYNENIFPLLKERYFKNQPVRKIFDGGCGLGASTLALGHLFPTSEIWACSSGHTPLPEVFDLIVLARVPYHGFDTSSDYELLASKVSREGFVLQIEYTEAHQLLSSLMEPNFSPIEIVLSADDIPAAVNLCQLWQRK